MKKIFIPLLIIIVILALTGCQDSNSPENTAEKYLEAIKQFDTETMREYAKSSEDMLAEGIDEMKSDETDYGKYFYGYLKWNASKLMYSITDTQMSEDGQSAILSMDCKYVYIGNIYKETYQNVVSNVQENMEEYNELSEEEANNKINEIYTMEFDKKRKNTDEKFKSITARLRVILVDDKWVVEQVDSGMVDLVTSGVMSATNELNGMQ